MRFSPEGQMWPSKTSRSHSHHFVTEAEELALLSHEEEAAAESSPLPTPILFHQSHSPYVVDYRSSYPGTFVGHARERAHLRTDEARSDEEARRSQQSSGSERR